MPKGRFTLILKNLHSMDHSERLLVEEIAHFVGGELTAFNEPLSTIEVEMSDAPEKLVNALCCAGLPAQLQKEVVLEAPQDIAILQITGMTCAACVGVVENALKGVNGVKSAGVNLLMKRAEVKHRGVPVADLLDAVDMVGFEAELLQELKEAPSLQKGEKLMVGHFKVEGMTCASCVGAVERAITALDGVKSAEISLTLKRAEVTYFPSVHAENVVEAIEDVGFEASVLNEVQVHSERTDRPSELPVLMTQSSTQLRKVATSIYGVRGVVVKDAQNARLLYDPVKVGARNLLQKLEGVCRYHEEVLEDPSVATLRRMKQMLLLSLPPTIMIVLLVEGFLPDAWEDEIAGIPSAFLYVLLLSAFVQFYCGSIFHEAAWSAALHKASTMNTLVSLSTTVSFVYGVLGGFYDFYMRTHRFRLEMSAMFCETSAVLITVLLGGRFMEIVAKSKTTQSLHEISAKRPHFARLLEGEQTETEIHYELIQIGDRLRVLPGEQVPVDGEVTSDGTVYCDESLLTGEAAPVRKHLGSQVVGGSSSVQGGFIMKASSAGNSTTLARILQLVEDAQTRRPSVQRNVDWIASYFTPVVLVAAVLTLLLWMLQAEDMDGVTFAITRAVSVLVIACPCSFGLATPTAVMVATGLAAKHGCLVKDATVWEKVSALNCAVLDKTGTITKGRPEVVEVALLPGAHALLQMGLDAVRAVGRPGGEGTRLGKFLDTQEESADASAVIGWLLQAVETNSEHPLAKALQAWAQEVHVAPKYAEAEDFQHRPGQGVSCSIPGVGKVTAGRTPDSLETHQQLWVKRLQDDACVVVALSLDAVGPLALLALRDQLQDGAREAVEQLHLRGFRVLMCTGDAPNTAHAVASRVGIQEVRASCLPENKAALVQELSTETEVLMVGDGLNDAAALASSSVGVAIGTGTQVTMESAQVILLGSKLSDLIFFLNLSRATMRTIYRNFAWALGFNIIGLPLAAGLGTPWGLQLPPSFCGSAMAFSSVLVVSSSLMLGLRYR